MTTRTTRPVVDIEDVRTVLRYLADAKDSTPGYPAFPFRSVPLAASAIDPGHRDIPESLWMTYPMFHRDPAAGPEAYRIDEPCYACAVVHRAQVDGLIRDAQQDGTQGTRAWLSITAAGRKVLAGELEYTPGYRAGYVPSPVTTAQAAAQVETTSERFRAMVSDARRRYSVEMQLPRHLWFDGRTPTYDANEVQRYVDSLPAYRAMARRHGTEPPAEPNDTDTERTTT